MLDSFEIGKVSSFILHETAVSLLKYFIFHAAHYFTIKLKKPNNLTTNL